MRRYGSIGELPLGGGRRVLALGNFDGVHIGHQAIIRRSVALARARGERAMVLTFNPSPLSVLRPEIRTSVLSSQGLKASLIAYLGADELLVIPFNRSFSQIRAERFVEMLAAPPINAGGIVVGEAFRFGHGGVGNTTLLRELGRAHGLLIEAPENVASPDGKPVSSTRIRRLIAQGQVADVIGLLARPHCIEGSIVHGDGRGRTIGIPTANLEPYPDDAATPAPGVYAGTMLLPHGREAAAINVGVAPTFTAESGRVPVRIEAHLLDYPGGDLYDAPARLEFVARLRAEKRFGSPDELVTQIRADIANARRALAEAPLQAW